MKAVIIYDDTGRKSEVITDIIGEKGFADVVVKRRRMEEYYQDEIKKIYSDVVWKKIHSPFEYSGLIIRFQISRKNFVFLIILFLMERRLLYHSGNWLL